MPAEPRGPILNFELSNAREHSLRPAFYRCNKSILLVKQMETLQPVELKTLWERENELQVIRNVLC